MRLDWLLVGALGAEVLPLIWALDDPRPHDRRFATGKLGPLRIGVLRCGVGPGRAERRTREALSRFDAERIASVGTCGGLLDRLSIGDLVTADRLLEGDRALREVLPLGPWQRVGCTTVTGVVDDAETRARLTAAGAEVCEMEASAVARAAGDRPFSVVKVVSDMAGGADGGAVFAQLPLSIARFNLLALRLSRDVLVPALIDVLREPD